MTWVRWMWTGNVSKSILLVVTVIGVQPVVVGVRLGGVGVGAVTMKSPSRAPWYQLVFYVMATTKIQTSGVPNGRPIFFVRKALRSSLWVNTIPSRGVCV